MNAVTPFNEAAALAPPPSVAPTPSALAAIIGQLTTAIASVMKEVDVVARRGENSFYRYSYAKMEDILKEVTPLLGRHGLVIFQSENRPGNVRQRERHSGRVRLLRRPRER